MADSGVWTCAHCGVQIGADENATEFIEEQTAPSASIVSGGQIIGMPHYTHVGHEATDIALGRHRTGRVGRLEELRANRHPRET
jgi:hypothetical protein